MTELERAAVLREAAVMVASSSWAEQQLMYESARLGDETAKAWIEEQGWYGIPDTGYSPGSAST